MSVRKLPSGRWHARLKSGRQYVTGRTFDTKRDAVAWLARERAAMAGGIDPRAGRTTVRRLLPIWLEERKDTVSKKAYVADREGIEVKVTKGGRTRRVPLADRVLHLVQDLARGKDGDELLFVTDSGHRLHASALKRTVAWSQISQGRRIHDLRHTAACLWLAKGVDPAPVQAWMGHTSIATTNMYLHHLGTGADRAG